MTAQKGKDLLIKLDASGEGSFTTMAGLRTRALAFNARAVDVTHAESAGRWRELLEGAGVRSAGITGRGIFKDAASDAAVRQIFFRRRDPQLAGRDPRFRHGAGSVPDHGAGILRRA